MAIVLEYKIYDKTKTNSHQISLKKLHKQYPSEIYHVSDLLDNVKLNVSFRDAEVLIIRDAIQNSEILTDFLLNFPDDISFIEDKTEEIEGLERIFDRVLNLKKDEFYISYKVNHSKFKRNQKQPFTIGTILNKNTTLKLAWFLGTIKISQEIIIQLNVGDIFILDIVSNGCFLGAQGLCVKFAFVS